MVDDAKTVDEDNPEWTEGDFAKARPFQDVFPQQYAAWAKEGLRTPRADNNPKVEIGFRLSADVVSGIKATGEGYDARVEKVLREALERGEL